MSDFNQAVVRVESFTGFGYFPLLIPAHQVLFETVILSKTSGKRRKLISDWLIIAVSLELFFRADVRVLSRFLIKCIKHALLWRRFFPGSQNNREFLLRLVSR